MTRVNAIPAEHLLDEWVSAGCREGLRPLNKEREGKYKNKSTLPHYSLGKGHELWLKDHLIFTVNQWKDCQKEWHERGFKGFDYNPTFEGIPEDNLQDYVATKADMRHNLARLCDRWRARWYNSKGERKASPTKYHLYGEVIQDNKQFMLYVSQVKQALDL